MLPLRWELFYIPPPNILKHYKYLYHMVADSWTSQAQPHYGLIPHHSSRHPRMCRHPIILIFLANYLLSSEILYTFASDKE